MAIDKDQINENKKVKETGTSAEIESSTSKKAKSPEEEMNKNKESSHLDSFKTKAGAIAQLTGKIKTLSLDDLVALNVALGEEEEFDDYDDDEEEDKMKKKKKKKDSDDDDEMEKESYSKKKMKSKEKMKEEIAISKDDLEDVQENLSTIFGDDSNLSEDFKTKTKDIFESVVVSKVNEKLNDVIDMFEENFENISEKIEENLEDKLDEYLNYVVEQWMEENQLEVDQGIMSEISESFMQNIAEVFRNHYVEIPEEKTDVVEELSATVDKLQENESENLKTIIKLNKEIDDYKKGEVFESVCKGLVSTDKAKVAKIVENIEYDENFEEKMKSIKENYLATKNTNKNNSLNEDVDYENDNNEENENTDPKMKAINDMISRNFVRN